MKITNLIRNWAARLVEKSYVSLMSRKIFERFNNRILNLALHARGFSNHGPLDKTGERHLLKTLKRFDIQMALDIGANRGNYSNLLINELNCKVVAFEPIEHFCNDLINIKSRHPGNFEFFPIALSDEDGKKQIFFSAGEGEIATLENSNLELRFVANKNTEEKTIQTRKLDSVVTTCSDLFNRIDFIKIDVEGHEIAVIRGAKDTIRRFKPKFIQLEFNIYNLMSGVSILKISKLLPDYKLFQLLPGNAGLAARDPYDPLTNLCCYSNFIFIRQK